MNDKHKAILEIAAKAYPTARTLSVLESSKWFNPNSVDTGGRNFSSLINLTVVDQKYQASTLYHSSPENLLDELARKADQNGSVNEGGDRTRKTEVS